MRFEGRDSRALQWTSKLESEERVISERVEGRRSPENLFEDISSWVRSARFTNASQGIESRWLSDKRSVRIRRSLPMS